MLFDDRESELVDHLVKANFKSLGPRFGRDVQKIARAVAQLSVQEFLAVEAGGEHTMQVDGVDVTLGPDDVIVERREKAGLFAECAGPLTVALDHALTPALIEEGLAREFVNRVQNLRKDADLHVSDRVRIVFHSPAPEVERAVQRHTEVIRGETLAHELTHTAAPPDGAAPMELNGHPVHIAVEKIEATN